MALLEDAFGEQLAMVDQDPARALSDSALDRVLAPNVALVTQGGERMLFEGTIPIRQTDEGGSLAKVDLDLRSTGDGYSPTNPIVDVNLPDDASEPIDIGDEGFAISPVLDQPASRARSVDGEDVQYFETQKDSDLIVSPLAAGAELFSLLRSVDSPERLRFEVTVPPGAELRADGEGGAEVVRSGARLIHVSAPTASDAQGAEVPVSMSVDGSFLVLTVPHRDRDVAYPVLVDPETVQENWYDNGNDWYHYGSLWALEPGTSPWVWATSNGGRFWAGTKPIGSAPGLSNRGLFISATSTSGSQAANQYGQFTLTAPGTDSYFAAALIRPFWRWDNGCGNSEPHDYSGLWSDTWGWATIHYNWASTYGYGIETPFEQLKGTENEWRAGTGHVLVIGMGTGGGGSKITCWRDLYTGGVNLWMDDWSQPVLSTSSNGQWMDSTPVRLSVSATDQGLGVRKFEAEATDKSGATKKWETWRSCTGGLHLPCPSGWNLGESSQPQLFYDPSVLPEGIDTLNVTAYDAVLRKSTTTNGMKVRVDHAPPSLKLSGSITEQATLGTEKPSYSVRVEASDGVPNSEDPAQARAGVTAISEWIDGKEVNGYEPGCATQSCSWFDEGLVEAAAYSPGQHTLVVKAKDALNHVAQSEPLTITLGDQQAPTVNVAGLAAESSVMPERASYWSSFGEGGSGNGKLSAPADAVVDADGDVWVVDRGNGRIQEFGPAGEFLRKAGTAGSGNGQFSSPSAIAVDANGNVWVADRGNSRIEKFNRKGEYLSQFGSKGTSNGQFAGNGPEGIAIDAKGNIWVSDTGGGRLQKFDQSGTFMKAVGSKGSGAGQLGEPTGIDIGPNGNVWIADAQNDRVAIFNEAGEFVTQFGSAGSGDGQLSHPAAIAVGSRGDVWVGDQGNSRIQEFDQSGAYVARLGTKGSGPGELNLGYPMGIATDSKGSLWITDTNNNRVQRWLIPSTAVNGYLEPIEADATDTGFGVTSLAVKLTDATGKTEVIDQTTQTCDQGGCPLDLDLEEVDLSEHPSGTYLLSVVATDGSGNHGTVSRVVNLDSSPPEIELSGALAESSGGALGSPSAGLEIDASDPDQDGGIAALNVERDGRLVASYPSDCSSDCQEVQASYLFDAAPDGADRSIAPVGTAGNGAIGELKRVSCVTASDCWAVGRTRYTLSEQLEGKVAEPLLEHWNGSEWQTTSPPKPAGATSLFLEGISCASSSACVAVGYYNNGTNQPLAEIWDGAKWTAGSAALPSGYTKGYLYGVSCGAASDCWAYGKTQVTTVEQGEGKTAAPFVDRWAGGSWQAAFAPKPEGVTSITLEGISCASSSACVAVGSYNNGTNQPLAEIWDGAKWTAGSAALPSGAGKGYLYGVSCGSATDCWAYGRTQVTIVEQAEGKLAVPFLARWQGSTWQASPVPKPADASSPELSSVSCVSAACTVVGSYANVHGETLPVAYTWDGNWRFQPMPTRTEATTSVLSGVSCTGVDECAAVGYSRAGAGPWRVFAAAEAPSHEPHQITVEAVDLRGNIAEETIEVAAPVLPGEAPECDPEPASEASKSVLTPGQAVEAAEEMLPASVAPSEGTMQVETEEQIEPSYGSPSPNLDAIETLEEGETAVSPEGGFTLDETACFTPASLTPAATDAVVANGDTAVFANTAPETDTLIRPTAMGATVIESLRGPNAPGSFSWNVTVAAGEELIELPSGAVAIVNTESEPSEGTVPVPEEPERSAEALADAQYQLEEGEYQLIKASSETELEVVAVIARPWVVLAQGGIVPALIEVVPDTETPNEFEVIVSVPEFDQEEQKEEEAGMLVATASASSSLSGHCPAGASPCGAFDFNRAARYAKYWGNEDHTGGWNSKHYPDLGSTNCTNFTSQVLRAGRMKFMRAFDHGDGSWWYRNLYPEGQLWWNEHDYTQSWVVADILPRHLWQFGLAHIDPVNAPWGWTTGDIIAYDWFGEAGKGAFDHLNFVVGRINPPNGPFEPLIANSSSPGHRYGSKPWRAVLLAIQEAEGEAGWTRVPLAVKHSKADRNEKKHAPQNLYGPSGVFQG